jgi:hypothetical protein
METVELQASSTDRLGKFTRTNNNEHKTLIQTEKNHLIIPRFEAPFSMNIIQKQFRNSPPSRKETIEIQKLNLPRKIVAKVLNRIELKYKKDGACEYILYLKWKNEQVKLDMKQFFTKKELATIVDQKKMEKVFKYEEGTALGVAERYEAKLGTKYKVYFKAVEKFKGEDISRVYSDDIEFEFDKDLMEEDVVEECLDEGVVYTKESESMVVEPEESGEVVEKPNPKDFIRAKLEKERLKELDRVKKVQEEIFRKETSKRKEVESKKKSSVESKVELSCQSGPSEYKYTSKSDKSWKKKPDQDLMIDGKNHNFELIDNSAQNSATEEELESGEVSVKMEPVSGNVSSRLLVEMDEFESGEIFVEEEVDSGSSVKVEEKVVSKHVTSRDIDIKDKKRKYDDKVENTTGIKSENLDIAQIFDEDLSSQLVKSETSIIDSKVKDELEINDIPTKVEKSPKKLDVNDVFVHENFNLNSQFIKTETSIKETIPAKPKRSPARSVISKHDNEKEVELVEIPMKRKITKSDLKMEVDDELDKFGGKETKIDVKRPRKGSISNSELNQSPNPKLNQSSEELDNELCLTLQKEETSSKGKRGKVSIAKSEQYEIESEINKGPSSATKVPKRKGAIAKSDQSAKSPVKKSKVAKEVTRGSSDEYQNTPVFKKVKLSDNITIKIKSNENPTKIDRDFNAKVGSPLQGTPSKIGIKFDTDSKLEDKRSKKDQEDDDGLYRYVAGHPNACMHYSFKFGEAIDVVAKDDGHAYPARSVYYQIESSGTYLMVSWEKYGSEYNELILLDKAGMDRITKSGKSLKADQLLVKKGGLDKHEIALMAELGRGESMVHVRPERYEMK